MMHDRWMRYGGSLAVLAALILNAGALHAAERLLEWPPEQAESRIPRNLRRNIRLETADDGDVLVVTATKAGKYCALTLPEEMTVAAGRAVCFEYRVEAGEEKDRPAYVGISFEGAAKKHFFMKKPVAAQWTRVVLPLENLSSTDGEVFSQGDVIRNFRIYTRNAEPVPAGAVKLFIRNLVFVFDPALTAGQPDRISYSAYPLFDWKRMAGAEQYRVEYSDAPDFPAARTRTMVRTVNYALPDEALTPGIWYYRATALPQNKVVRRGSVKVPERRHVYRVAEPDFAAFGTVPHPRLKRLATFNLAHDPTILPGARKALKLTLPPDAEPFREGADPAIPTRIDWLRVYGGRIGDVGKAMTRIGQAALATGDEVLTAKARELAVAVAREWDPDKASHRRYQDLAAINLLMGLGFCYDAAYETMNEAERRDVNAALMARGRQFWKFINPFSGNEAQNHSWDNTQAFAFAAVAADGNPEERAVWFDYALKLYAYRFLPSLGFDGENNEGLAYWRFGFNLIMRYLDLVRQTTGINLYALDYVRKTAAFGLYSAPLAGYEMSFGDNGTPNHHGIWTYSRSFCRKLAIETGYPEILWYASVPSYGELEATVPLRMPQSVTYPHIGVSFFNTFLPDARENVALGFHSGKYFAGHQHADQNSFSINAYGDKLVVDGGYYDWWGSEHFHSYSVTTRAHNTLLVNGSGQAVRTPEADGATTAFADFPAFGYVAGDAGNPKIYGGKLTRFQREIVFVKPDAVITLDRVAAPEPGAVFSYLLHAQGHAPTATADGGFSIRRQFARLDGRMLTPARVAVKTAYETPPNDMWSSDLLQFHEKEWIIQADFSAGEFLAAMEISRAGEEPERQFVRRESPTALGVGADGLLVAFNRAASGRFELDALASDGRAAAVRLDAAGNVIGAMMVNGTFLEYRGKTLCRLEKTGSWSFPEDRPVTEAPRNDLLTLNGNPVPAKLYSVTGGDGGITHLVSAKTTLPHAGFLSVDANGGAYILGCENRRYVGRAPRTNWVEQGDYLLSFTTSGGGEPAPVRLTLTSGTPIPATVLPTAFQLPENAVRLEAETPAEYEGEELYLIDRPFASGGQFGFRFHQSDQLLRWRFKLDRPGRYRVLIRSAAQEPAVREIARSGGQTVAMALEATGGDGRKEADWRWMELPGGMEFDAGEQTLEMRFNRGTSALDVLALIPEKE